MPVRTTSSNSSSNNNNRHNKMKLLACRPVVVVVESLTSDDPVGSSLVNDTQSDDVCASSCTHSTGVASPSTRRLATVWTVDVLAFVPVVLMLWQQWTAAVPYAVLQSR